MIPLIVTIVLIITFFMIKFLKKEDKLVKEQEKKFVKVPMITHLDDNSVSVIGAMCLTINENINWFSEYQKLLATDILKYIPNYSKHDSIILKTTNELIQNLIDSSVNSSEPFQRRCACESLIRVMLEALTREELFKE